ncbi:MAG: heavy metal translocating P-type ATPase [Candidatus Parabeggiatoa sp.]|nr:heavy metal translocating P-type ATPase [Candidatus Parabeggiatoa sp.]
MLLEFGVLIGIYLGARALDNSKQDKTPQNDQNDTVGQVIPKPQTALVKKNNKNKLIDLTTQGYNHYVKVSVLSMGLAVVRQWNPLLNLLSFGTISYLALPVFKHTEQSVIEKRKLGYDVQVSALILMCVVTGQYFALSIGYGFHYLGRKIVAKTQDHSKKLLTEAFVQQSSSVWILKEGVEMEVPLETLNINEIVVVTTGEVVPIDGIVTAGEAMIDQHALTGESQPAEKGLGDQVFASTLVVSGKVYVKVEKAGQETTIAKIRDILEKSTDYKTQIQLKGEQWADQTALPVLGLSILALPIIGPFGATAVLSSSFGNRLRITAPLGTLNYLNVASHKGILVKDGRVLELLNTVDTVLFDKTGTLTEEQPKIGRIIRCEQYEEKEVLKYAAAAERKLAHPIARSIIQEAENANLILPEVDDSEYQIGYGITVNIDNQIVRVGSVRFMNSTGLTLPDSIKDAMTSAHEEGHSLVIVAVNGTVIGALEMQTQVRSEVKEIMSGLRQRGIKHIAIVSGDHRQPTQKLAESLGMDSYYSEVLPENKASIVEQLQKEGKVVCFIGDGINDAIAMKRAQVSISLSGATSLATDTAQIILLDGSLSHLCTIFDISHNLDANLRKSFIMTLVPGIFSMTGAFFWSFTMIESVLINNLALLLGLGNAMRPLKEIKEENSQVGNEKTLQEHNKTPQPLIGTT